MNGIRIIHSPDALFGSFPLPASKSISNRALIIKAISKAPFVIENLSEADDTVLLKKLFDSGSSEIYVKNAGTVARFLLAYYASVPCDVILTGSYRMKERPVGDLVQTLVGLGADIVFLENDGQLPVHIIGKDLDGGEVDMAADVSSQFISAMLLIAPTLRKGLKINIIGGVVSEPYISLTLGMMDIFGISFERKSGYIYVPFQLYKPENYFVESDWSSAAYIMAIAVLLPGTEIAIPFLFENSQQGDAIVSAILKPFGLKISFNEGQCHIRSKKPEIKHFDMDMIQFPDLIPTMVCLCCALRIPFTISGSRTLQYKESNRGAVLKSELAKAGYSLSLAENTITYDGNFYAEESAEIVLNTHDDHRMAMSFVLLAILNRNIRIENVDVVEKSFPSFWIALEKAGFVFENLN